MSKSVRCLAFVALLTLGVVQAALAQDRRQNQPGEFDFYVLSLSWSPSFCEAAGERPPNRANTQQCGDRPFSFVVHGLWPQYETGFPEYCRRDAPRPDRNTVASMLDLMPATNLIFHEWEKHGTCAGLPVRGYFETIRKARAAVRIPDEFVEVKQHLTVKPAEIEEAFVKANPGLSSKGVAVACSGRRLSEVRVCMNKDLSFRDCAEIDRRACTRTEVIMPPLRAGRAVVLTQEPKEP